MNEMLLTVSVDPHHLLESIVFAGIPREQIVKLVLDLDLLVGEVDFTEELIKALVKSLVHDKDDVKLPFIDWEKV